METRGAVHAVENSGSYQSSESIREDVASVKD